MSPDSSDNAQQDAARAAAAAREDHLLTALTDWLAVLDNAIAGDLNDEQRAQLSNGAAELRQIMTDMKAERERKIQGD